MGAGAQFVTALEHTYRQSRQYDKKYGNNGQAVQWINVGLTEKAVTEAIDHVKKWIEVRHHLPEWRQRMDRIKHPGQKDQRHDQKILKCRQLIELLCPNASYQSHGTQDGRTQDSENQDPPRRHETEMTKPGRHDKNASTNNQTAHDCRQHIATEHFPMRQGRQQHKHQITGDLRLYQR